MDFSRPMDEENYAVIELTSELDYFSDHVENSLVTALIVGGTVDKESFLNMYSGMDGQNQFGGWARAGMKYRAISDSVSFSKPTSLFLEFGSENYGYVSFPKDAFYLSFIGNADRLGDQMVLSHTKAQSMTYQFAGLGIQNEETGSYLSFNLINVQKYFSAQSDEFTLFTGEDAAVINLEYDAEVVSHDSLRGGFLSNSGAGFTLNGRYNLKVAEGNDLFSIEVRNAGIASLNPRTNFITADSTFYFDGINIDQLFSSDNPLNTITLEDSLSIVRDQKSRTVAMPLEINSTYYHRINKKDHIAASFRKRFFSEYRPELGFSYFHNETKVIGYQIGCSYGGYGGLRLNAGVFGNWENWRAYLTTRNLIGAFLESAHGRSVSFGISRTFRSKS